MMNPQPSDHRRDSAGSVQSLSWHKGMILRGQSDWYFQGQSLLRALTRAGSEGDLTGAFTDDLLLTLKQDISQGCEAKKSCTPMLTKSVGKNDFCFRSCHNPESPRLVRFSII